VLLLLLSGSVCRSGGHVVCALCRVIFKRNQVRIPRANSPSAAQCRRAVEFLSVHHIKL